MWWKKSNDWDMTVLEGAADFSGEHYHNQMILDEYLQNYEPTICAEGNFSGKLR
jgi:hypothetical protein